LSKELRDAAYATAKAYCGTPRRPKCVRGSTTLRGGGIGRRRARGFRVAGATAAAGRLSGDAATAS
jgi:hypothetical protein